MTNISVKNQITGWNNKEEKLIENFKIKYEVVEWLENLEDENSWFRATLIKTKVSEKERKEWVEEEYSLLIKWSDIAKVGTGGVG